MQHALMQHALKLSHEALPEALYDTKKPRGRYLGY
jgi:hypothetical protein